MISTAGRLCTPREPHVASQNRLEHFAGGVILKLHGSAITVFFFVLLFKQLGVMWQFKDAQCLGRL